MTSGFVLGPGEGSAYGFHGSAGLREDPFCAAHARAKNVSTTAALSHANGEIEPPPERRAEQHSHDRDHDP